MSSSAQQLLPKQHGFRRRYYTPQEVAAHNNVDDAWVSIFHKVYDLTSLLAEHRGRLTQPIALNAGRDLSHWFCVKDGKVQVKEHYDEARDLFVPYTPMGRFVHVPAPEPEAVSADHPNTPWWRDEQYIIGQLSAKVRKLRIVNTLTRQEDILHVCSEETIAEIQTRYVEYNAHASSYTWKQLKGDAFVNMDMGHTLAEAGIPDETDTFDQLGIDDDLYIPTVHVYYNDDLTEM